MPTIVLNKEVKDRLTKYLINLSAEKKTILTYSRAVDELLILWESIEAGVLKVKEA